MKKIKINKDYFSRLFVLAKQNKVNLKSFTFMLVNYYYLEFTDSYTDVTSLVDLFNQITNLYIDKDDSYGIYDDAYWCGTAYFYLKNKCKKSLAYILLKLPVDELIDMYSIYHEMDYSSLYSRFVEKEKEKTIFELLCEYRYCSLAEVARKTGITINTIKKYNLNDEFLLKASFQNIIKISDFFDINIDVFKNIT